MKGSETQGASSVATEERNIKKLKDVSYPIDDNSLPRVWSIYLSKNPKLKESFDIISAQKKAANLNTSDPAIYREMVAETIEQLSK